MHVCMILDPDVYMHVRCLYIYVLDPDTCDHDAHMYDAFIHDP